MPAPAVKGAESASLNQPQPALKTETMNDSFSYSEAPLNVGVLEGPKSYSKTPIADEIKRRELSSPREKMPQTTSKANNANENKKEAQTKGSDSGPAPLYTSKKQNGSANLSALMSVGSMVLIALMTIPKGIHKIIKHK